MRELIMFWCFYDKENILILFRTPSIEKKNASHANDSPFQRWQQPSLIATHSHTITINFIIISYLYRTCDTTRMIKYAIWCNMHAYIRRALSTHTYIQNDLVTAPFFHLKSSKFILMHSCTPFDSRIWQINSGSTFNFIESQRNIIFPQFSMRFIRLIASKNCLANGYQFYLCVVVVAVVDNHMGSALLSWMTKIQQTKIWFRLGGYYCWKAKLYGGRNKNNNWCHSSFLRVEMGES